MAERWVDKKPDDITDDMMAQVDRILERYRGHAGSLIPVLQQAQQVCGYLPPYLQDYIGRGLGVPGSTVFGVVTFYSFFTMTPRGRHTIRVCMGTACFVRGAGEALDRVRRELGLEIGGTTEDRRFSLEAVRCLGACGLAPVTVIGDHTHRFLTSDKIVDVINRYE